VKPEKRVCEIGIGEIGIGESGSPRIFIHFHTEITVLKLIRAIVRGLECICICICMDGLKIEINSSLMMLDFKLYIIHR
jgi:hypothetical protein